MSDVQRLAALVLELSSPVKRENINPYDREAFRQGKFDNKRTNLPRVELGLLADALIDAGEVKKSKAVREAVGIEFFQDSKGRTVVQFIPVTCPRENITLN
jgi:hypothetical protein